MMFLLEHHEPNLFDSRGIQFPAELYENKILKANRWNGNKDGAVIYARTASPGFILSRIIG